MKMTFKTLAVCACVFVCAVTLPACSVGKSTQLGKPAKFTSLSYEEKNDSGFNEFKQKVEKFASELAPSVYRSYEGEDNLAVSPISVYMALSLASECANGYTRAEILNALGVSYEQLRVYTSMLYRSLNVEYKYGNKVISTLNLGNSIWVNDGTQVKQDCIDALSDYYFSYSYSADFKNNNLAANRAVQNFVKQQTNGVINNDFKFTTDTLFALINTLYLKTIWNTNGRDLPYASGQYNFSQKDGTAKQTQLLQGYYNYGKVYAGENYSTFYTVTCNGYKIKFIVPKDGYGIGDVFTAETVAEVNSLSDYNGTDEINKIHYYTRCIFPEFKASFNGDLKEILKSEYGINYLFDMVNADYSSLTDEEAYCSQVKHVTDLTVNKKGIEGAAVTIINNLDTAPGPDEYMEVYEDFMVDKAFGYIITDYQNVTLFSGVVNNI